MDERKLRVEWEIWIRRLFYSDYFKCGKVPREGKANKERKLRSGETFRGGKKGCNYGDKEKY